SDRELVATFRCDEHDDFYMLYATRESEIHRSGVRHLLFPTPVPTPREVDSGGVASIERHGNRWCLPGTGLVRFAVDSPGPPVLLLALRIVRSAQQPAREGDAVAWSLRSDGFEVASGEARAGEAPVRVQAIARAPAPGTDPSRSYEFEIESRDAGSPEPRAVLLEASEILVRYGDPLRASDFKLSTPRCRERIDHVETIGMTSGFFGW